MIYLYTFPLWAPLLLLVLYALWVQSERGGVFKALNLVGIVGLPWDWFMQHTLFNLFFWEVAPAHEPTVTMRLQRLVYGNDWRSIWAIRLSRLLNWIAPKKSPHVIIPGA